MSKHPPLRSSVAVLPARILCALCAALCLAGCGGDPGATLHAAPYRPSPAFSAETRPAGPAPEVVVASAPDGSAITVSCATCHATREPNPANAVSGDLDLFHQGLRLAHGGMTCLSCHDPADPARFRLASGQTVAREDSMRLCAQCHGPQMRDYARGAHGGMTGHWDLSKGGRVRNACVHCHDPHAPKYQGMTPALAPLDRFLQPHPGGPRHD